uniref:7,8-dihydroneopterin aldolase n=1 Tax=Araucaria cunninghamii TaxID=56994 RepID=A0A0D6R6I3_ARACU
MDSHGPYRGDKLILKGLKFHGFHGVHEAERQLGQKFLVDIDAWLDLKKAGKSDKLEDTVSYAEIYRFVKEIVEGPPHALIESVAESIACGIFYKFPGIHSLCIRVGKPHVAVPGAVDYLGVEIYRTSKDLEKS